MYSTITCFVALAVATVSANLATTSVGTQTGPIGGNTGADFGGAGATGGLDLGALITGPGVNFGGNPGFNAGIPQGSSNMPLPLHPTQTAGLWQQFFMYRMFFGDSAARMIMADRLAQIMGGSPFSRYYAGEYFDTPDSWWMASSFANSQRQQQANPSVPTGAAVPGAI